MIQAGKKIYSGKRLTAVFLFPAVIVIILAGCTHNIVFEKSYSIHNASWRSGDTLKFPVTISDTITPLSFYFNIRNTTKYGFSNLYMYVTTYYPDNTFSRDTVECWLAAPDGKWLGKGIGNLKDNEFTFRRNVRMPRKGNYIFSINQAMRYSPLTGIADVGIRLEKQNLN